MRGLIQILTRYKFTIVENTPIDEEIALDPELLGKVFENLLASYNAETRDHRPQADRLLLHPARHRGLHGGRGADRLPGADSWRGRHGRPVRELSLPPTRAALRTRTSTDVEIDRLVASLDDVKILDPACGFGAFPWVSSTASWIC